jgi:NAD(P)-dependent dehydrogenase (short-subunit alcohol dehydrogenase family)
MQSADRSPLGPRHPQRPARDAGGRPGRNREHVGARPEDVASGAASAMVTGRFTRPEEVADLVLLLASDVTGNDTGADIRIGGLVPTW